MIATGNRSSGKRRRRQARIVLSVGERWGVHGDAASARKSRRERHVESIASAVRRLPPGLRPRHPGRPAVTKRRVLPHAIEMRVVVRRDVSPGETPKSWLTRVDGSLGRRAKACHRKRRSARAGLTAEEGRARRHSARLPFRRGSTSGRASTGQPILCGSEPACVRQLTEVIQ